MTTTDTCSAADTITAGEFAEYLQASAETYRFLSQTLFRELNEEAIDELARAQWPSDTGNDLLDKGYAQVRRYFNYAVSDKRTQLAVEYARVFLAAGVFTQDRQTAVPYESVFTSEGHIMMQESRDDVVRRFLADGFKVNPDLHEPEDHLSFELEYLCHMSESALAMMGEPGEAAGAAGADADLAQLSPQTQASLAKNVGRQVEFIDEHILNWVGDLRDVAKEYAQTTFYTGVLYIVEGAAQQSREMLGQALAQLESASSAGEDAEEA